MPLTAREQYAEWWLTAEQQHRRGRRLRAPPALIAATPTGGPDLQPDASTGARLDPTQVPCPWPGAG